MSNEPNKPIEAEELTEKELEGIVGGRKAHAYLEVDVGKEEGLVCIVKLAGGRSLSSPLTEE